MILRTVPVEGRDGELLRDIYSDVSDIPVARRVHHSAADEIVKRWNAQEPSTTLPARWPLTIYAARSRAGLLQREAAALVHRTRADPWQAWETGKRPMPIAEWELFLIKTGQFNRTAEALDSQPTDGGVRNG